MTINQANMNTLELAKKAIDLGILTKEDSLSRLEAHYTNKTELPIRVAQQPSLSPLTSPNKPTYLPVPAATASTTSSASSTTPTSSVTLPAEKLAHSYSSSNSKYDHLKSEPASRFSESERLLIEYFKSRDNLEAISVNETASAKPPGPGYDQEEYDEAKALSKVRYEKFGEEFLRVRKGEKKGEKKYAGGNLGGRK